MDPLPPARPPVGARIPYGGNDDGNTFFLRCRVGGFENHNAEMPGRPMGAG